MNSPSTDKSPVLPTPEQRPARRLPWICLVLAIVTAAIGTWLAQQQLDQPLTGIDDASLTELYETCLFTVYPSLYENKDRNLFC